MKKVLCFGEILLRLSPVLQRQWIDDARLSVYLGGAELNVATALAGWSVPVAFCSALPPHYLADEILAKLEEKPIQTSKIIRAGERIGTYYLPDGSDLKNTGVIYDRQHSAFSALKPGGIDWDFVFDGIDWFHFSAINPALNADIAELCREGLQAAIEKGLTISVDLNDRAKLWQYGKQPSEVMPDLVEHCHIVMGNIWSANRLLGIPLDNLTRAGESFDAYIGQARKSADEIGSRFSRCQTVAFTFRMESEHGIEYYGTVQDKSGSYVSERFHPKDVSSKIGTGDCFMAGLIYGLLHSQPPQDIVNFASAAAVGKMAEKGDATHQTIQDVQKILNQWTTPRLK
jgi:2-dehydro-3-deoxygluconokinase